MKLELNRVYDIDIREDPVRPELSLEFRLSKGREIYALREHGEEYSAFVCVAYTNAVPASNSDLEDMSEFDGKIAVPYTVWSTKRGFGKEIIKKVLQLSSESDRVIRVVTLSPQTDMARRFHIKNGAIEVRQNPTSINFEYILAGGDDEQ